MAPLKRPGTAAAAVTDNRVNFGESTFYTAGGGAIPEGNYALFFDVIVHQFVKQSGEKAGPEFLAVRVAAYPLDEPGAEPKVGYYSMGKNAIQSFMPNADDEGKSLVAVPNGPAKSMNETTNWAILLKSLKDSAMPEGTFTNDLRAIDGVWAHITNIPEPEERKGFGAATGEVVEDRKNKTIAVVSEILEGGAPWEGGGGLPEEKPKAAPARVVGRVAPKAAAPAAPARPAARVAVARPAPKAAPEPEPEEAEAVDNDVLSAAQNAATSVLEASPEGVGKLVFKTGVFKAANKTVGGEMAQAVLDTYFASDDAINALLGDLGYVINGAKIVPVE